MTLKCRDCSCKSKSVKRGRYNIPLCRKCETEREKQDTEDDSFTDPKTLDACMGSPKDHQDNNDGHIIINELLCYLCNKIDLLPMDVLVKICTESFSEVETLTAKRLLFDSIDTDERYVKRKGPDSHSQNLKDVSRWIHETEMVNLPTFVAMDLSKLPSVDIDHIDVTSIVSEVKRARAEISAMKDQLNHISKVCTETTEVTNTLILSTQSLKDNIQKVNATIMMSAVTQANVAEKVTMKELSTTTSTSVKKLHGSVDALHDVPLVNTEGGVSESGASDIPPVNVTGDRNHAGCTHDVAPSMQDMGAASESGNSGIAPVNQEISEGSNSVDDTRVTPSSRTYAEAASPMIRAASTRLTSYARPVPFRGADRNNTTNNGMNAKKSVTGTGKWSGLSAVKTGPVARLFVTRLQPETTVNDVIKHIQTFSDVNTTCEKLVTKYDTYASFCITLPRSKIDILLSADKWPENVLVRKFYQRK